MYVVYDWAPSCDKVSTQYGHEDVEKAIAIAVNRIAVCAENEAKMGHKIHIGCSVPVAEVGVFIVTLSNAKYELLERYIVKKD